MKTDRDDVIGRVESASEKNAKMHAAREQGVVAIRRGPNESQKGGGYIP